MMHTMTYRRRHRCWHWVWLWLVVLLVAACSNGTGNQASGEQAPVEAVRAFVSAMEARDVDTVLTLLDPTDDLPRQIGPELRSTISMIDELRIEDATYTLVDTDGQVAHVQLTGNVTFALHDMEPMLYEIDNTVELVNQDGTWYLSDIDILQEQP
ncbi:MAG: hypothetical protein HC837_16325 [Chloroflexaceae bacterium]|nr:hypothetical protein [Chloroflexaceae bacterium]